MQTRYNERPFVSRVANAVREALGTKNPLDMPFDNLSKPQRSTLMRNAAKLALMRQGYALETVKTGKRGRRHVLLAKRDGEELMVAIRTSQDGWMGYPSKGQPGFGKSLDGVDAVIAVLPDRIGENAEKLEVYQLEARDLEARFMANYNAHEAAGRVPNHPAMWLPLHAITREGPASVGGGVLEGKEPIGRFSIEDPEIRQNIDIGDEGEALDHRNAAVVPPGGSDGGSASPRTVPEAIAQAKAHIARITGMPLEAIKLELKFIEM